MSKQQTSCHTEPDRRSGCTASVAPPPQSPLMRFTYCWQMMCWWSLLLVHTRTCTHKTVSWHFRFWGSGLRLSIVAAITAKLILLKQNFAINWKLKKLTEAYSNNNGNQIVYNAGEHGKVRTEIKWVHVKVSSWMCKFLDFKPPRHIGKGKPHTSAGSHWGANTKIICEYTYTHELAKLF